MQTIEKAFPAVTTGVATIYSETMPVEELMMYSWQITVSGGSAAGDLMPQGSNDGVSWADLAGSVTAYTVGATKLIRITDAEHQWARLKIIASATGSAVVVFSGKGP